MSAWTMLSCLITLVIASAATYGQQLDGPYRRPILTDSDRQDGNDQQVADRRYVDYFYDTDVPEKGNNLQYVDDVVGPDSAVRNRQRPAVSKYNLRNGAPIPNLMPYEEFHYDRSCQYQCKCRTLPHDKYADVYVEERNCTSGKDVQIKSCPNGLVYTGNGRSGLISVCDYPHRVAWNSERPRHNPPISTEHCDWLYGIFGHETSCTRYWTCWNGTATEQNCIGGLLYNEETHACDWPQNVGGCQKHPLCKDDPNGNVALGRSCNRYWACQGGYPRLQRCPAMLVFSKTRKRCLSPPTEDCDVPPPPPQVEGEDDQGSGDSGQSSGPERPIGINGGNRRRVPSGQPPPPRNRRPGGQPPDFQLPSGALPINLN